MLSPFTRWNSRTLYRNKGKSVRQCLSGNEEVVWTDDVSLLLQFRANFCRCLGARAIQRQFDQNRDEPIDLLSFPRRVLGLGQPAKQFIHSHHRNRAIRRRHLIESLHHAGPLAKSTDACIGIEKVCHQGLKRFYRWQPTLVQSDESRICDMNRIKKTVRPRLWLEWFQYYRIAVLTHRHSRCRKVKPFRQADSLALALVNDSCSFHNARQICLSDKCQPNMKEQITPDLIPRCAIRETGFNSFC